MLTLSDRCKVLREDAMQELSHEKYTYQRALYYIVGMAEARQQGLSGEEVMAAGITSVLENFRPHILPGELVVGYNYGNEYPPVPQNDPEGWAKLRENGISDEFIHRFFALGLEYDDFWRAWDALRVSPPNPEFVIELYNEAETQMTQEWASVSGCCDGNHSIIGYEYVLQKGFDGLLADVEKYEAQNGTNPLYRAMKTICQKAVLLGQKYANEAQRLLDSGDTSYDTTTLQTIRDICLRVPRYPATNFREAVQAIWFSHILHTWEDRINANSLGRLDQILYPYYRADIAKGILTQAEAFEWICCLWIKLYRAYDVQQCTVGGTRPDGTSAVNELSYLMLDATEQLDFIRCMSVRFSANTEKAFLQRAMEVVSHTQKGVPFFFNDDVMVPALIYKGIAPEDAYDYAPLGCVETDIPGRANPHAVTAKTNLLKALEYTLCDGHSMMYPELAPGLKLGDPTQYATFDSFYTALLRQIDHILDLTCSMVKKACVWSSHNSPLPLKSLLTKGCMESGRDYNDKGATYDYYQICLGGVPNLADSLAAVRQFVYEEHHYTLPQLKQILEENFRDEDVRQEFIHKAPKYGNDIDEVDRLAADIVYHACKTLETMSEKYGISFHAQPFTYLWMLDQGRESAASPDGRRRGETTAYSCSPMQGRDMNGLTALFNTLTKLPTGMTPGTTSAIVEVDPKLFCDDNLPQLTALLIAAGKQGLSNVQFNIANVKTLQDAQNHPEKHPNLVVRVSGFSHKFVWLAPELQEHIIARHKHQEL